MTRPIDFDRLTEEWLSDGPSTMSDRALKAALDEVHVTHQRRLGVARRTYSMNRNLFRMAAAAAAVGPGVGGGLAPLGVGGRPGRAGPAPVEPDRLAADAKPDSDTFADADGDAGTVTYAKPD